jgi:hypothetical protein
MATVSYLVRRAMTLAPRIESIRFDFIDCEGVPFVWIGLKKDQDEEAEDGTIGDYNGPEGVPTKDLERISYDLMREFGRNGDVTLTREDVLG